MRDYSEECSVEDMQLFFGISKYLFFSPPWTFNPSYILETSMAGDNAGFARCEIQNTGH